MKPDAWPAHLQKESVLIYTQTSCRCQLLYGPNFDPAGVCLTSIILVGSEKYNFMESTRCSHQTWRYSHHLIWLLQAGNGYTSRLSSHWTLYNESDVTVRLLVEKLLIAVNYMWVLIILHGNTFYHMHMRSIVPFIFPFFFSFDIITSSCGT